MAKVRIGGRARWPKLTSYPGASRTVPALQGVAIGAASAARLSIIGEIDWADGADHNIASVRARLTASSFTGTGLRLSMRDPSTAAGPPGRDDGSVDQSAVQAGPAANTNYTFTLDAVRAAAQGSLQAVVFDYSAWASGSVSVAFLATPNSADWGHRPVATVFDGTSTYTVQGALAALTFVADDGTTGVFHESFPRISAAINAHAIGTGSSPNRIALEFTVPAPMWFGGFGIPLQFATGADFDIALYEGTTLISGTQKSVVTDTLGADAAVRWVQHAFPDIACVSGQTYRLELQPTTAALVTAYSFDVSDAAHLLPWGPFGFTSRTGTGSFAALTSTRFLFAFLDLVAIDGGGGAGGLLTHPGMAGGMRA
jgi:hypothetical protein